MTSLLELSIGIPEVPAVFIGSAFSPGLGTTNAFGFAQARVMLLLMILFSYCRSEIFSINWI